MKTVTQPQINTFVLISKCKLACMWAETAAWKDIGDTAYNTKYKELKQLQGIYTAISRYRLFVATTAASVYFESDVEFTEGFGASQLFVNGLPITGLYPTVAGALAAEHLYDVAALINAYPSLPKFTAVYSEGIGFGAITIYAPPSEGENANGWEFVEVSNGIPTGVLPLSGGLPVIDTSEVCLTYDEIFSSMQWLNARMVVCSNLFKLAETQDTNDCGCGCDDCGGCS